MNYRYWISVQQPQGNEAPLMVGEPIVFKGHGEPSEYPLGIYEVNLVTFEIRAALRFMPSEPHIRIVYTRIADVKTEGERPLTIRLVGASF